MTHLSWLRRRMRRSLRARLGALLLASLVLPAIFAELVAADYPILAWGPRGFTVLPAMVAESGPEPVRVVEIQAPYEQSVALWPAIRSGPDSISEAGANAAASWQHPLGTDRQGRDVVARLLYGTRRALGLTAIVLIIAVSAGGLLGALAGYRGGVFDELLARPVEFVQVFPSVVVVAVARAVEPSGALWSLVLAIAAVRWAEFARLVRAEVARLNEEDFIAAARALGCPRRRIVWRHMAPHAAGPLVVSLMFAAASIVLLEVAVSFLGLGVPGSLGGLIAEGLAEEGRHLPAWWAAAVLGVTVGAAHLIADALSEGIDARVAASRRRRTWGPIVS